MYLKRRILIAASLVILIIAIGTTGYNLIEGWGLLDSIFMTVTTITTVGYREVHPLSKGGMIFTIILILTGLGIVFYILNMGARVLIEGEIRELFGRRRLEKRIKNLKGHQIVCGFGRMGKIISREFKARGLEFVVIERDPLSAGLAEDGILFIAGDATKDEVLKEAGIDTAVGLISVLPTDAENLYTVLTAKGLNPNLRIVARAGEEGSEQKLLRAGADKVVSPYYIGGLRIAHTILKPAVCDFVEFATRAGNIELQMEEISVQEKSGLDGQTLDTTGIGRDLGVIIVSIIRPGEEMMFNPTSKTVLKAGDVLIALGDVKKLAQVEEMARRAG
jgi:voltage-gated potassium channel